MSSLPERNKNMAPGKVRFLRSTSFQKLCLAAYPFQLAGSICTRDTLKQLVETTLWSAKAWMQKVFLVMSLSVFNLWRATVSLLLRVLTAIIGVDEAVFIEYLKYEKSLAEQTVVTAYKVEPKLDETNDGLQNRLAVPTEDSHPIIHQEPTATILLAPKSLKKFSPNRIVMTTFVYGSTGLVYVQLTALLIAVNNSQTPPGLLFLITSLGLVGYIMAKISFMKKPMKVIASRPSANRKDCSTKSAPTDRQSRAKLRPSIYLTLAEQRLSKIKLL